MRINIPKCPVADGCGEATLTEVATVVILILIVSSFVAYFVKRYFESHD